MNQQTIEKKAYDLFPENWDYDGFKEDGTPTAIDINEKRRDEWIEKMSDLFVETETKTQRHA